MTLPPVAAPRLAATVVVVRDSVAGIETLLLRRAERGDHNSGAWVFPGGVADAADAQCAGACGALDDAQASARLGLPSGGLALHVAALRECFEECGLLFAQAGDGAAALPVAEGAALDRMRARRAALQRGDDTLVALCRDEGLRLAPDRLIYLSHWVTPLGLAKRFDTRFFVARAPEGQQAFHDAGEMVEQCWLRPADALSRGAAFKLMTPTAKTLATLAGFDSVAALLAWAGGPREVRAIVPRLATGRHGPQPVLPDEPAWAELGRIDPQGRGHGACEIVPGVPVRLSPGVIRVTAGNAGMMTGPGTNSYLVGGGPRNEWAVVDPGPADPLHLDALVAAAPGPIRWILATHTHRDHSPGAAPLRERTGATVHGRLAAHPIGQDESFVPDRALQGGERIALDGATLRVLHTPGHASNHLCYLLEEEHMLFTGDHVMQGSTVVINPPDGNMAAYLQSLRSLLDEPPDWLAPGHGFLIAPPRRAIEALIAHRLARRAKVVAALHATAPASVEALLAHVYHDVPERLHGVAARSLQAHLEQLQDEGAARCSAGLWAPAGSGRGEPT